MSIRFAGLLCSLVLASSPAWAAKTLPFAIGQSVPATADALILPHGPSRASGGERFTLKFAGAKTITNIKISAFSTNRNGKALVHNAYGVNASTKVSLEGLYKFGAPSVGNATNYNGKNMLTDSSSIEIAPNQSFTALEFQVEGYTNDDASILLQVTTAEDLEISDYLFTRTAYPKESAGGLIDESRAAKFTPAELRALMQQAKTPAASTLAGRRFSCTAYTKLNPTLVNYKERSFSVSADGKLQSESDLEGPTQAWTTTAQGQVRTIQNVNGCGTYASYQVLRAIGSGSLISEVVTDLEAYVKLCVGAGYDENAVRVVEANSTFPSAVNAKYVVDSYEFCQAK